MTDKNLSELITSSYNGGNLIDDTANTTANIWTAVKISNELNSIAVPPTDLTILANSSAIELQSSSGNNVTILSANSSTAGFLSAETQTITGNKTFTDTITYNGTIDSDFIPELDVTYDLGSANNRWRDLYLSGNTINLGDGQIKADEDTGTIALIPPVTVNNPNPKAMVINSLGRMSKVDTTGGEIQSFDMDSAANASADVFESINVDEIGANNGTFSELSVSDSFTLPSGTTAERPANPVAGMIRFNTDEGYFEGYDPLADDWFKTSDLLAPFQATGGTETTITDNGVTYKVHTFTSSGTFEVTQGSGEVECLVVAGGGGGGSSWSASGGGAGGLVYKQDYSIENGATLSVVVGNGGVPEATVNDGGNGENSSFGDLIALGGGGGVYTADGKDGGSGSGGAQDIVSGGVGLQSTSNVNNPPIGYGNDGGSSTQAGVGGSGDGACGGGGAGQKGGDGAVNNPGPGGNGLEYFGSYYAGGGGGGEREGSGASGGLGGGGDGSGDSNAQSGIPNTGGGGGGTGNLGNSGGTGGSGIVIVRYPI